MTVQAPVAHETYCVGMNVPLMRRTIVRAVMLNFTALRCFKNELGSFAGSSVSFHCPPHLETPAPIIAHQRNFNESFPGSVFGPRQFLFNIPSPCNSEELPTPT